MKGKDVGFDCRIGLDARVKREEKQASGSPHRQPLLRAWHLGIVVLRDWVDKEYLTVRA